MGASNGYWNRHPKKELQALLMLFHRQGWRIDDRSKYYKVLCPCGAHKTMIHISPSNPNYATDKDRWLRRQACYKEQQEGSR